jgi:hypothetical protein
VQHVHRIVSVQGLPRRRAQGPWQQYSESRQSGLVRHVPISAVSRCSKLRVQTFGLLDHLVPVRLGRLGDRNSVSVRWKWSKHNALALQAR